MNTKFNLNDYSTRPGSHKELAIAAGFSEKFLTNAYFLSIVERCDHLLKSIVVIKKTFPLSAANPIMEKAAGLAEDVICTYINMIKDGSIDHDQLVFDCARLDRWLAENTVEVDLSNPSQPGV